MKVDPVQVDPEHYQVEFENDKVRILRVRFGPHEKSPMHSHPGSLIVYLTPHHSKHTDTAGDSNEIQAQPGDIQWIDPTDHLPENLSSLPMELILVELKP